MADDLCTPTQAHFQNKQICRYTPITHTQSWRGEIWREHAQTCACICVNKNAPLVTGCACVDVRIWMGVFFNYIRPLQHCLYGLDAYEHEYCVQIHGSVCMRMHVSIPRRWHGLGSGQMTSWPLQRTSTDKRVNSVHTC